MDGRRAVPGAPRATRRRRCSRSRCSGRGCPRAPRGPRPRSACGFSAQQRGDLHQEARACRTRTGSRGSRATPAAAGAARRRRPAPSMVVIVVPVACTASIRHDRTGSPSRSTVHAPHTPCSQPRWVPVRPRSSRRKSASVLRASATASRALAPLTVTSTSQTCRSSPRPARSARRLGRAPGARSTPATCAVCGRRVQVADAGLEPAAAASAAAGERRHRSAPSAQLGLGVGRPHRAVGDADQREPGVGDAVAVDGHRRGDADHGEVAVAAGDLLRSTTPVPGRAAIGNRTIERSISSGVERGREVALEEVGGARSSARRVAAADGEGRRRAPAPPPAARRPGRRGPGCRRPCRGCGSATWPMQRQGLGEQRDGVARLTADRSTVRCADHRADRQRAVAPLDARAARRCR